MMADTESYPMPALTDKQREDLITRLGIYIRTTKTAVRAGLATEEDLFNLVTREITLAALTAQPVYQVETFCSDCWVDVSEVAFSSSKSDKRVRYISPPVPAMNLPDELREKDTDYQNLRDEKRGFNSAIAEVKRLNGVTK